MPKLPSTRSSYTNELYQTEKNKEYLVVEQNQIVQNTCFTMPLVDQKILAFLIRSIKPGQTSLKLKFSTRTYMKLLGMRWSGTTFDEIRYILKHLADDSFYIKHSNGSYDLWRWIYNVHADPNGSGKGDFIVTFQPYIKPYLFNPELRDKTIYKFSDIMLMRSKYSPRLYEIFKSNRSRQKIQKRGLNYGIDELKIMLNLVYRNRAHKIRHRKDGSIRFKYPEYYEFKRHILIPSCEEINKFTEYNVRMTPIHKHGRKTVGINVVMLHKNKEQIKKRDDLIFFITHHIPKKQWKTWREDKIRGNFHKVKPRKRSKHKVINGKYKIIEPSSKPSTEELKKLDDILNKHKIPFREVNMSGNRVEYYSPLVNKYIWTTYYMRKKQMKVFYEQKRIEKQLNESKEKNRKI